MKNMGFGLMRLPLTDKDKPESIDQEQFNEMAKLFLDKGYAYFDTAYPYHNGKSETALKEAVVNKYPRDSFIIADKLPIFSITKEEELESTFNEQLARCGVDYFDYYLLHNVSPFSEAGFMEVDSYSFLQEKKEEGKIKKLGFSTHGNAKYVENFLKEHPDPDFIQLQLNYLDWESEAIQSKKCYEVAGKYDLEVIAMEPLKGGTLANIPAEAMELIKKYDNALNPVSLALKFVASLDGVFMVLSGSSSYEQIEENIDIFDNMKPITEGELELIEEVKDAINSKITVPCTNCNYCINECPANINIPLVFDLYNQEKLLNTDSFTTPQVAYLNYSLDESNGLAKDCVECGRCVQKCPQHINIPEIMKDATQTLVYES